MITRTFSRTLPGSGQILQRRGLEPDRCIFFDIETTGFKPETSSLYLIGAAFPESSQKPERWTILQWLAESPGEEKRLLESFSERLTAGSVLVHFNGRRFDLPYLEEKYRQHGLPSPLSVPESLDLYRDFRPLKKLLGLERMNQKSLETFLGNCREDMYDGGQLIPLYRQFVRTGEQDLLAALLLHNREDVTGMLQLLTLYGYVTFLETFLADDSSEEQPIQTELICLRDGSRRLLLRFFLDPAVPVPLSRMTESGAFSLNQNTGKWLIPVREDPLRYYFPDWKNYYYLPEENQALHKSVAVYVDKKFRQPCTPENCYITRTGPFLPQPEELFSPGLRENRKDRQSWFPLTDEFLQDQKQLKQYLAVLLKSFL